MSPDEIAADLRAYVREHYPGRTIDLHLTEWRRHGFCPDCQTPVDVQVRPDGTLGAHFHRLRSLPIIRTPHDWTACRRIVGVREALDAP